MKILKVFLSLVLFACLSWSALIFGGPFLIQKCVQIFFQNQVTLSNVSVSPRLVVSASELNFAFKKDNNLRVQNSGVIDGRMRGLRVDWGLDRNGLEAHFFTRDEKITLLKSIGVIIGFTGVVFLFFDKLIINENNFIFALITILGSTFYSIGGIMTLRLKKKGNENVTTSTTLWSVILLFPLSLIFEKPWYLNPSLESTLSLLYLGVVATGLAWLIRFRILTVNGIVFQTQVAYLIPIFGVIFGYFLMDEIITWRVLISLFIIIIGIYIVKKNNKGIKK